MGVRTFGGLLTMNQYGKKLICGFMGCLALFVGAEELAFVEKASEVGLDFRHYNGMNGALSMTEVMGGGAALFDFDNDGDLDVYLVQGNVVRPGDDPLKTTFPAPRGVALSDRLFKNLLQEKGTLQFEDVTKASGIRQEGYGMGVTVGDFDRDGWLDLYVTNYGANALLRNRGDGTFEDATVKAGVGDPRWNASAAFLDIDGDSWLDLFVTSYLKYSATEHKNCYDSRGLPDYCGPTVFKPQVDRLYKNQGDGTFKDITERAGVSKSLGPGLGVVATDLNKDGRLDLYVTNDQSANSLWLNQGQGTFIDDGLLAGCAVNLDGRAESSMGITAGDIDDDGDDDLFLTHFGGETNTLYLNDGTGGFLDATMRSGLALPSLKYTSFGTEFFDFDRDGDLDLITVNGAMKRKRELVETGDPFPFHEPNQLYRNLGNARFEEVKAKEAGPPFTLSELSLGAAVGDVDNDGDMDVLVTNNNGPVRLLLNTGLDGNHWIGVRAVAGKPHRDQVGARLEVKAAGGKTRYRRVHTDGSYLSARDSRVLVGLGNSKKPVTVKVQWPNGIEEEFPGLEVDRYYTLVKGQGRPMGAKISHLPKPTLDELDSTSASQVEAAQALVAESLGEKWSGRHPLVEALSGLGLLYHTYGFNPAARAVYEEVIRWNPKDFQAHYLGGVLAQEEGDPESADRLLAKASELRPNYLPSRIRRGEALFQRGQPNKALSLLESVVEDDPMAAPAFSLLGQIQLSQGKPKLAVQSFERVLHLQPQATKTYYSLAAAYRTLGRREEAMAFLGRQGLGSVIFLDPEMEVLADLNLSFRHHLDRCTDELEVQRPAEAIKACLRSLELDKDNATTRINLGVAMARVNLTKAAIAEYREALRIDPKSSVGEFGLGTLLARLNRFGAAEVHYRRSLDLDPEGADVHFNLANALRAQRRCEEAIAHYLEAADRMNQREGALVGAAQCRTILGECREALDTLEPVKESEDLRVVDTLARIFAACDDDSVRDGSRALSLAKRVLAAEPSSYHAATLAMAYAEVGEFVAAVEWQQNAIGARGSIVKDGGLYERQLETYRQHRPWRKPWS